MADKVLAIVRETLLHENTVECLSFRPATGEVCPTLLQPDEKYEYPDHELLLTFSGVRSFDVAAPDGEPCRGEALLTFECAAGDGNYRARVSVGGPREPGWVFRVVFERLRFKRSARYP